MSKKWNMKETGPSFDWKFVSSDNSVRNISKKLEKFSKTGQENKSLISTFACFLTNIAKVLTSRGDNVHWAICPPKFEIFPVFPTFPRS